jgi:hypothetical protein
MQQSGPAAEPFTRSRTQLFLSYRETRTTGPSRRPSLIPYTPYLDDADDWGTSREDTGLMSDLESGTAGRRGSRGGQFASGGGGGGAKLPPVWVDSSDKVDDIVDRIKPKSTSRVPFSSNETSSFSPFSSSTSSPQSAFHSSATRQAARQTPPTWLQGPERGGARDRGFGDKHHLRSSLFPFPSVLLRHLFLPSFLPLY